MSRKRKPNEVAQARAEAAQGLALDRAPTDRIDLVFSDPDELAHVGDAIWQDVSCLAVAGRSVFCSRDETASVERVLLSPDAARAAEHVNYPLGRIFDLPDGPAGEMDIEGLAIADGWLWVCGSHSLTRDAPEEDGIADMREIDWDPNRGFLGRVPRLDRGDGIFEPVAAIAPANGAPARRAAMLPMRKGRKTPLRRMLARDKVIGAFVALPCKENGLDIEGLAVRGDTVLLGLRGPVVKGHAILVRMEMKRTRKGVLKPRRLAGGARCRLQALDPQRPGRPRPQLARRPPARAVGRHDGS